MKKNLILLSVVLVIATQLLISCKKNTQIKSTRIIGTLTNKTTGEPMPNVEIKLNRGWSTDYGGDSEYVTSFYTDDNGNFEYKFHAEKFSGDPDWEVEWKYWIEPYLPFNECVAWYGDNFFNGENMGRYGYNIEKGEKNDIDIEFEPYQPAWLKLHIKNQYPYDENDQINIRARKAYFGLCEFTINDSGGTFTGMSIDTNILVELFNMGGWGLHWSVTKNGSISEESAGYVLYFNTNDTIVYEILY